MPKDTRSFFERLTGTEEIEEDEEMNEDEYEDEENEEDEEEYKNEREEDEEHNSEEEGELAVDMYETHSDIFIKTVVSGVRPEELDISITREKVVIRGNRTPERGFEGSNYHIQELYWGAFSRSIDLPQEVEVDEAEAVAKHGLLVLKLPKINKERETKLKVKTG
ncbi:MAG: Hsp20/alpha crystallin family protein [Patescibacteria group bacterium]